MDKQFLEYFVDRTDKRFDKIEAKIDTLLKFKWQIISGSIIASMVITMGIQLLNIFWKR